VVDTSVLLKSLQNGDFEGVYDHLTASIFRAKTMASLNARLKKFTQYNLHSKYFLVGLFMTLNSSDRIFIEKSRILCLSCLPLMFVDTDFRKTVQQKILDTVAKDAKQLVHFENKQFYQFIKRVFKEEETFNMKFHFEKYFSLSGFLRDILNEIIKLQGTNDSGQPMISPKLLLKVLDIITYFFSGNLDLRRSPHVTAPAAEASEIGHDREYAAPSRAQAQGAANNKETTFIFANLIDYKSFEFLSKLYKVSEKLVDHDGDMLVMNMWYKVVENRPHNFEILAKFLIHNLSSFIMKIKTSSSATAKQEEAAYGIEYEK